MNMMDGISSCRLRGVFTANGWVVPRLLFGLAEILVDTKTGRPINWIHMPAPPASEDPHRPSHGHHALFMVHLNRYSRTLNSIQSIKVYSIKKKKEIFSTPLSPSRHKKHSKHITPISAEVTSYSPKQIFSCWIEGFSQGY
jgi:hypothetical protein